MSEQVGVKELKEAILGLVVLGKAVAVLAKDGVDLSDAVALGQKFAADPAFKDKVLEAVKGIDQVPAEVKDLTLAEGLELAALIPQIIDALKA
jgi:hypothetical protein